MKRAGRLEEMTAIYIRLTPENKMHIFLTALRELEADGVLWTPPKNKTGEKRYNNQNTK